MLESLKQNLITFLEPTLNFCSSLGASGLFILAMAESVFFPIPPDFLYTPMILNGANNPYYLALVASMGSILGAAIGYALGALAGRKLLDRFLTKGFKDYLTKFDQFFEKYGPMSVLIAAFTPIPFKVFTLGAGLARMDFFQFIFYAALGRAGRFFAVTFLLIQL